MKKQIFFIVFFLMSITAFPQSDVEKLTKPIVEEGKRLYMSEMASWYGTDIFIEKYKQKENIGGYLSYSEKEASTCIFFSKGDKPKVIGTMIFDAAFNVKTAITDLAEREFSKPESELYAMRAKALQLINSDTIFKQYKNTNLNLVPLISKEERKVYVLTGPQKSGIIIFGNDYLMVFDKKNNLISRKRLHKNIIVAQYGQPDAKGRESVGGAHTHLPETGDFITATDICTLMLYEKDANWLEYYVSSENYMSKWDCLTNTLTTETLEKTTGTKEDKKK